MEPSVMESPIVGTGTSLVAKKRANAALHLEKVELRATRPRRLLKAKAMINRCELHDEHFSSAN